MELQYLLPETLEDALTQRVAASPSGHYVHLHPSLSNNILSPRLGLSCSVVPRSRPRLREPCFQTLRGSLLFATSIQSRKRNALVSRPLGCRQYAFLDYSLSVYGDHYDQPSRYRRCWNSFAAPGLKAESYTLGDN